MHIHAPHRMYEKNPLWLGVDMLAVIPHFTSQDLKANAKRFDSYAAIPTTDEDSCIAVEKFGYYHSRLG